MSRRPITTPTRSSRTSGSPRTERGAPGLLYRRHELTSFSALDSVREKSIPVRSAHDRKQSTGGGRGGPFMRRCAVVVLWVLVALATAAAVQAADTPRRGGILLAVIGA